MSRGLKQQMTVPKVVLSTAIALFGLCLSNATAHAADNLKSSQMLSDSASGDNWPGYGRTYGEQHFSPLTDINDKTVEKLGLAWSFDLDPGNPATVPIAVDGKLYTSTGYSIVQAFDVATGERLWKYDPEAYKVAGIRFRQGWGSRGLAWWNGKIYVGTVDGRLIALDADTGKEVWSVQTLGEEPHRFITGAPRVFEGKVIIGHGGADHASIRGYVTTYDAETGKQLWRFHTVPGNPADGFENDAMKMAAETWSGEWWKFGGGGTVWNAMTYDAEYDQILLGTGNGSPWNHKIRSKGKGDNLFLCSIVALDAKTGEYRWHYQVNPGESWDFNAAMDMHLGVMDVEGKDTNIVATAPKNGFFYVLDRSNGKLISADKIATVTWASHIDLKTGRPVENPLARYPDGKPFIMMPSPTGAHSWMASAYNDEKDYAFIPVIELAVEFSDNKIDLENYVHPVGNALDGGNRQNWLAEAPEGKSGTSFLLGWDVAAKKEMWRVPTPGPWNGGIVATAGNLVFQGDVKGMFNAYAADTGKLIWSYDAGGPIVGTPITYRHDGKQYVTVLTGMGSSAAAFGVFFPERIDYYSQARRVVTFALDADGKLPAKEKVGKLVAFDDPVEAMPSDEQLEMGAIGFERRCAACHGAGAISGGHAPDLRGSGIVADKATFLDFLKQGYSMANGMPKYDNLPEEELESIHDFLRVQASMLRKSSAEK